jgi:hypothetical protein
MLQEVKMACFWTWIGPPIATEQKILVDQQKIGAPKKNSTFAVVF